MVHKKSFWDVAPLDVKKFLLEGGTPQSKSILKTFYRVLIDTGEFQGDNPITLLNEIEEQEKEAGIEIEAPKTSAETVLETLRDENLSFSEEFVPAENRVVEKKKPPKPIMTLTDLEHLLKRTHHIRERAILEILFATGAKLKEIIELNVSDIDLEGKKIMFFETDTQISRVIAMPKRALPFLRLYERWRLRQLSPSNAYFITKKTKERMRPTTVSSWLARLQRDKEPGQRWTIGDFRKRAILQHYWLTKDLAAVSRFAGYKRPEAGLRVVNQILEDRGIENLKDLTELPEFDELQRDKKKLTPRLNDQSTTITISLDPDELEMIRKSGLTPTQAVKTVFSLKDLYSSVAPAAAAAPVASSPLAKAMSVSAAPPPSRPSGGSSGPRSEGKSTFVPGPVGGGPPSGPSSGGGGGLGFLSELKSKLQERNKAKQEGKIPSEITIGPQDHFANVQILDSKSKDDSDSKSEEEDEKEQKED